MLVEQVAKSARRTFLSRWRPGGPEIDHTQGLATAPRAWEAHVISFLTTALHPAAPAVRGRPPERRSPP